MPVFTDFLSNGVIVNKEHAHVAAHFGAGRVVHQIATLAGQSYVDLWAVALLIESACGVNHVFTRDNALAFQKYRPPHSFFFFVAKFKALPLTRGSISTGFQTEFQIGRFSQNLLGAGGILHTRQFNNDPVTTLLLHNWFANTQFVDPIAQSGEVLGNRVIFNFTYCGFRYPCFYQVFVVGAATASLVQLWRILAN